MIFFSSVEQVKFIDYILQLVLQARDNWSIEKY